MKSNTTTTVATGTLEGMAQGTKATKILLREDYQHYKISKDNKHKYESFSHIPWDKYDSFEEGWKDICTN